jgi:histidinol-phosphate aminotransferase
MGRRKFLSAIVPYAKATASRQACIRLDLNENRFAPSPSVLRALRRLSPDDLAMYPESEPLQRELAKFHGLEAENVLLANGGDQAIRWVFETFVEAGATVVWAAPTFSIYPLSARLRQARIQAIPFTADFSFPLSGILASLATKPSLLVLVSPNNPTGTVVAPEELRQILEHAGETPVLLDEAYGFFSGQNHATWINEFPNLVILNSFSKAYALAGIRLGYLLAKTAMLSEVEKVALPYALSVASIRAGLAALADMAHARRQVSRLQRQKHFLIKGLLNLGIPCRDTAANFILARFDDVQPVWDKLRQAGLLTKNLDHEPQLTGYLRITVGSRSDNQRLLKTLGKILPVQAILFDMDGVLVDVSESYDQTILQTVASFYGQKPDRAELQLLRLSAGYNNDWQATAALLAVRNYQVDFAEVVARFQEIYLGLNHDGLCRQERWLLSAPTLRKLAAQFSLGIVTGRPRLEARWTLSRFGYDKYFKVMVSAEDTGTKSKPHPKGIRLALRRLGVRRAVYIGDLVDDILAAKAAGVRAVAVLPAAGNSTSAARLHLQQSGADKIINDINDIMEVLDETSNYQA